MKYQCAAKKNKTVDVQQYTILKHLGFHKIISDNVYVYLCVTKIWDFNYLFTAGFSSYYNKFQYWGNR